MDKGFTLLEVLILIAVFGVLAAIATPFGAELLDRHRLSAASRELYAILQEARLNAMTKPPGDLGHGIRFSSDPGTEFEILEGDLLDEFGEEPGLRKKNLPRGISMSSTNSADDVLIFDRKGFARQSNSSSLGGRTYILENNRGGARCVTVSAVRILEGVWNGSCQIQ